jgi:uncharacterized protein (TIGR00369 family)
MAPGLSVAEINDFVAARFPAAARVGVRCEEVGDRFAVARWEFDGADLLPTGHISGPRIFGIADAALWFATLSVIGLEPMAVTSEMSIRFLRPARGRDLLARAVVNSEGSRRLVGTVEVWMDGSPERPVAVAQGSYAHP